VNTTISKSTQGKDAGNRQAEADTGQKVPDTPAIAQAHEILTIHDGDQEQASEQEGSSEYVDTEKEDPECHFVVFSHDLRPRTRTHNIISEGGVQPAEKIGPNPGRLGPLQTSSYQPLMKAKSMRNASATPVKKARKPKPLKQKS
jgi:hypothetical protein